MDLQLQESLSSELVLAGLDCEDMVVAYSSYHRNHYELRFDSFQSRSSAPIIKLVGNYRVRDDISQQHQLSLLLLVLQLLWSHEFQ